MYWVYGIAGLSGELVYVGMTCRPRDRWRQHFNDPSSAVYDWLRRAGSRGCRVRIYAEGLDYDLAVLREDELIWRHRDTVLNRDIAKPARQSRLALAGMLPGCMVGSERDFPGKMDRKEYRREWMRRWREAEAKKRGGS